MVWRQNIVDAARLACWRRPLSNDAELSIGATILLFVIAAFGSLTYQFSFSRGWSAFVPDGLNSTVASTTVAAMVVLLFSRAASAPSPRRALLLFISLTTTINLVTALVVMAIEPTLMARLQQADRNLPVALATLGVGFVVALTFWSIGAARQAFRTAPSITYPTLRAVGFVICLHVLPAALPVGPAFWPEYLARSPANLWVLASRWRRGADEPRETSLAKWKDAQRRSVAVEAMQPQRLGAALAAVAPRAPDASNIFLIGVSGDSEEDVFQHETEQSLAILKSKFATGDRALALVNDQNTTERYPIASIQNLSFVLREIGKRIDREKDVLILTMTSHGSQDGFALVYGDDINRTLSPVTLKSLLDDAGIKNRVVIVSACHSGVFVPVLADPDTMILTAASATRTSFGCANGRDWTYFGDALFAHGLKTEPTLAAAFATARTTIGQWETKGGLPPSDPQIFVGDSIARRFPHLVGTFPRENVRADTVTAAGRGTIKASD